MTPDLSILIPTRNRANYLVSAIKSALACEGNIEIIVSENHGLDDGWEVCNSFKDSRLRVIQPSSPLPMSEHYNFLINRAAGKWVTIIGDDDAILPYATEVLLQAAKLCPSCEAIVSPRAYYQWRGNSGQGARFGAAFKSGAQIEDSKTDLLKALNGQLRFIYLPQIYSGGFHRQTLINRVRDIQGGQYIKSRSPDAYSALIGVLNTPRYLRIETPLTLVGTSPQSVRSHRKEAAHVFQDIIDSEEDKGLEYSPLINSRLLHCYGFGLWFYDTLYWGSSIGSTNYLNDTFLKHIFFREYIDLQKNNNIECAIELSKHLNFVPIRIQDLQSYEAEFPMITRDPVFDSEGHNYERIGDLSGQSKSESILDMVQLCNQTFRERKYTLENA